MESTLFLGKFFGLFLMILGLFWIIRREEISKFISNFSTHPILMVISGVISTAAGILVVLSHNVWTYHWPLIITLLGYLILIQGISRLLFPEKVIYCIRSIKKEHYPIYGILVFILGLYLSYLSFCA